MINIDSLTKPEVFQTLEYETILQQNINNFKTLVPNWNPVQSDDFSLMLEAFSLRELHLKAEFNNYASAFFLPFATGGDLDYIAFTFYNGIKRLSGSKPYATYEFSVNDSFDNDVTIPKNLVLTDDTNKFQAILLDAVVIKSGEKKASGIVELQLEIHSSDIKTQIITTPLPFVVEVKANSAFLNGRCVESDEDFKQRALLSMADKSTAGSEATYKSFTFKADERVEDVSVRNGLKPLSTYVNLFVNKNEDEILKALKQVFANIATVEVFYYSPSADELMQTRIEEMLNKEEVRPLTDKLLIAPVIKIPFNIKAELKILANQETATIYSNAMTALGVGIKSLKQIGTDITLSEINNFLKVPGVKEVIITAPTSNILVANDSIGVNDANAITYTII
jgi:phage-related baseplate assembly protein